MKGILGKATMLSFLPLTLACSKAETGRSEIELISDIAENTRPNFLHDDFNLLVVLSLLVAGISLYYAVVTYKAQKRTESNTNKLSRQAQRSLLNDLIRHMYRNLVICYTIRTKLDDCGWKGYPSEEHFLKMKIPLENIHLDVFYENDSDFRNMHELYLNMRNYNEELEVAMTHFTDAGVPENTRKRDFGTLEFKAFFLVGQIMKKEYSVWGNDDDVRIQMEEAMSKVVMEKCSAKNNIPIEGYSDVFGKVGPDFFAGTAMSELYGGKANLSRLADEFNEAVRIERGLNDRREEKIHIIRK